MKYERITAPKFHITVDVVIFTLSKNELKMLLIKRANEPFHGQWALPGGFLQAGETLEQASSRILRDKAGVNQVYTEQLYVFDSMDRDIRGHIPSVAYFALVPENKLDLSQSVPAEQPDLFSPSRLPELAFDHAKVVAYAIARLRSKLAYSDVAFSLLPQTFTLSQLQKTHELILGHPLDKRNFRKKYLALDLLEATGSSTEGGKQRPAQLYRFRPQSETK